MTEGIQAIWATLWGPGIHRLDWSESPFRHTDWIDSEQKDRFCRMTFYFLQGDHDLHVSAAPRKDRVPGPGCVDRVHALWVSLDSGESGLLLRQFRPAPTLVVRKGVKQVAFWALSRPVAQNHALRANLRLSTALRGRRRDADPDEFMVPLQGREIIVGDGLYRAREVVQRLRDAPNPNAWRDRGEAA